MRTLMFAAVLAATALCAFAATVAICSTGFARPAPRPAMAARIAADGMVSIPLTPAPLFIVSRDAEGLLKAVKGN